jgi:RimJ/RimL family protein N-acetyltransferase
VKSISYNSIELRNLSENDLPTFFEQQLDPVANRMAAFPPRDKEAFMTHWRTKVLANVDANKKSIIVDGHLAGYVTSWEQENNQWVGYWIGREYWGNGIATRALTEFLVHFKTRPLHAYVAKHNMASIRVLEKCGFLISEESTFFSKVHGREIIENLMVLI